MGSWDSWGRLLVNTRLLGTHRGPGKEARGFGRDLGMGEGTHPERLQRSGAPEHGTPGIRAERGSLDLPE